MKELYKLPARPEANGQNILQGDKYRITMLTEGLVRLEYSEDGVFEDRATQTVINRDFPPVKFQVKETEEELEILTWRFRLNYNKKEFNPRGLRVQVLGNTGFWNNVWHYGDELRDLKGTARTLDTVDGACELGHGLVSQEGFSVLDDSASLILTEEGWVAPRKKGIQDIYFWGYGLDYLECLKDFYYLCGKTPMLPRFALGNWWSRYYEYTEASYLELMNRFDEEGIPFTVAVIDMDWHLVNIDPKYGTGWTGYTWNREFFPDPKRFMDSLHERGMRITLNVHPADGIRPHEEMYEAMAKELGKDISREEPVAFEITDPAFLSAYFKYAHHPNEEKGVDFWWLDWQQGGITKMEGLDPLWMLNHFHFLDSARNGKRPMTFSRYAGPGSHRYPVGFSGDTVVTWESLKFQPYFTSTASNIGYGWWSHDIGGHMNGYKDDELEGRWYQFGVFSPVNRLHSTKNEFNGKEPWRFNPEIHSMMNEFLQLRHKMVPYLYTMNYRAYAQDTPLVLPMYYYNPRCLESYRVPNEYYFGTGLVVAPITAPRLAGLNRAKERVWLPEGTFIDFFSGTIYEGGRMMDMYRDINTMPVFAKAGAIIPMTEEIDAVSTCGNPSSLTLKVYAGADGSFALYEDDNETCDYEKGICAVTELEWKWDGEQRFAIHPVQGELSLVPEKRDYTIEIWGCSESEVLCTSNGKTTEAETSYDADKNCLKITVKQADACAETVITFVRKLALAVNPVKKMVYTFLDQAEMEFDIKTRIYQLVCSGKSPLVIMGELQAMDLPEDLVKCISEMLTAQGSLA
ncbi:TIM-barrel domain-containing protein [Eisenbergiella sp.]